MIIVKYEVRKKKQGVVSDDILCFRNGHPAQEYQYLVERTTSVIAGINNWEFIDTVRLGGDLLDPNVGTDQQAEDYVKTLLILCYPFRQKEDLMDQGSYVSKFRLVSRDIFDTYGSLLQNIQDIRNAERCKCRMDELARETEAFRSETNGEDSENEEEVDDNERQYLDSLFTNMTSFDDHDVPLHNNSSVKIPTSFNLQELQKKGAYKCGYQHLSNFKYSGDDSTLLEVEEEELDEEKLD